MRAVDVNLEDEDLTLVLTMGLPADYDTFVISHDTTPSDELTVNNVITRLLNEESRMRDVIALNHVDNLATATAAAPTRRAPRFGCGKKGHYQLNCPAKVHIATNATVSVTAATAAVSGLIDPEPEVVDFIRCML